MYGFFNNQKFHYKKLFPIMIVITTVITTTSEQQSSSEVANHVYRRATVLCYLLFTTGRHDIKLRVLQWYFSELAFIVLGGCSAGAV